MVKPTETKKGTFGQKIFLVLMILLGAAFLPVSTVLVAGMLPTFAAFMADQTRDKTRSFTIALLNFVTCFPFALEIATQAQTMETAISVLTAPLNVIIMFAGAAAGYFLDWTLAGISNVIMMGRARRRLELIDKRLMDVVRRWGEEVTGRIPLDPDGFPIENDDK